MTQSRPASTVCEDEDERLAVYMCVCITPVWRTLADCQQTVNEFEQVDRGSIRKFHFGEDNAGFRKLIGDSCHRDGPTRG